MLSIAAEFSIFKIPSEQRLIEIFFLFFFYRGTVHGSSKVVNASVSLEPVPGDRVNKTTGCSLNTSNILQEVPLLVVAIQLKSTSTSHTDSPVVIHLQAVLITL